MRQVKKKCEVWQVTGIVTRSSSVQGSVGPDTKAEDWHPCKTMFGYVCLGSVCTLVQNGIIHRVHNLRQYTHPYWQLVQACKDFKDHSIHTAGWQIWYGSPLLSCPESGGCRYYITFTDNHIHCMRITLCTKNEALCKAVVVRLPYAI